jgi:hypothetical protein
MVKPRTLVTLTEAQSRGGYSVVFVGDSRNQSNSRTIPYAEVYRERSSVMETPAEHIQKAAEEDKRKVIQDPI